MCGCESWTVKKAEHQKIYALELWCCRRLLRVLWTARRSRQSTLKKINLEYSLKKLMLKLKLQYFGHFMRRADSLEKTLMREKIEGKRRRDGWMESLPQWTWVWANSERWWRTGKPGVLLSMRSQRVRHDLATGQSTNKVDGQEDLVLPSPTSLFSRWGNGGSRILDDLWQTSHKPVGQQGQTQAGQGLLPPHSASLCCVTMLSSEVFPAERAHKERGTCSRHTALLTACLPSASYWKWGVFFFF